MGENFDFFLEVILWRTNSFIWKVKAHIPFSSHHINLIDGKQDLFERKRKYKETVSTVSPDLSPMLLTSSKMNFICIPNLVCPLQEVLTNNDLVLMMKARGRKILDNPPPSYIQLSMILRVAFGPILLSSGLSYNSKLPKC